MSKYFSTEINKEELYQFSEPERTPDYKIVDERFIYEATWQAKPTIKWPPEDQWSTYLLRKRQGFDQDKSGPWAFNWIVRREPCFLTSGDLPRFALEETPRNDTLAPPFFKMGDLRIRVIIGEQSFWLDERGEITVRYYPWGTVHRVNLEPEIPLTFEVVAFLAGNKGIAVEIKTAGNLSDSVEGKIELYYGGLDSKGPHEFPEYFKIIPEEEDDDTIEIDDHKAILSDDDIPYRIAVITDPVVTPVIESNSPALDIQKRVKYSYQFNTDANDLCYRLLAYKLNDDGKELKLARFTEYLRQAQEYYEDILNTVDIKTPDRVLNSAFYAAVVNLDYAYKPPAWLEGIHEWNTYYTNNYQISAAIDLGQLDRSREALLYFGDRPEGPGYVLSADGSVAEVEMHRSEDGLPYYILQLYRYWQATGDEETIKKLWKPTCQNLERMLEVRDPDGDGLLDFHKACNAFLYQADRLSLPGSALSPTVMMTHMLEKMAEMAIALDKEEQAQKWCRRAAFVRKETIRRLWLPEKGCFASGIDTQNKVQQAAYYTDFVFPELYSKLPREYTWLSLKALDRTLWIGDHLLRTGNYLPDYFGNNAVHSVAMPEAAQAYFQAGCSEQGWALLHGTALSATILTDSPGSFPEYCSFTGYGLPDWVFSNPIGAYIHSVVSGLFGFERTVGNKSLFWHPSIPANWESASLRLGETNISIKGKVGNRTYEIELESTQPLTCRLPLYGHQVKKVGDAEGQEVTYELETHPGGGFLIIELGSAKRHKITVFSEQKEMKLELPEEVAPGAEVSWYLPKKGLKLRDPQQVFRNFKISGRVLGGRLNRFQGKHIFFLVDKEESKIQPYELNFREKSTEVKKSLRLMSGERKPMLLDEYFNNNTLPNKTYGHDFEFDLKHFIEMDERTASGKLIVEDFSFKVRPAGQNLVLLEIGDLDPYSNRLKLSSVQDSLIIDICQTVIGVELLLAAESRVRLTNMEVGFIGLHYNDGFVEKKPLVYGRNLDCCSIPFATEVAVLQLNFDQHVTVCTATADEDRVLEKLEFSVDTFDTSIAIFAINIVKKD